MSSTLFLHEVKGVPQAAPYGKIVEAYGLRKCPKLVEQIAGDDLTIRVNALSVLCDEFNNPYSIVGCAEVGAIKILATMISDPDYITRDRASKALSIAAKDANGVKWILNENVIGDILSGIYDPSVEVRVNIYECLYQVSKTKEGVDACVIARVPAAFVASVLKENDQIKALLLKVIYNLSGSDTGREDAMAVSAVKTCIDLLKDNKNDETITNAARTLGFLCFDERAKEEAIFNDGMVVLFAALKAKESSFQLKAAIITAIMAISSTDEGKRQILSCDGVEILINLLGEDDRVMRLNTLKVITNAAVFPPVRVLFKESIGCMAMLTKILDGSDSLLTRHAEKAIAAVNWKP